MEKTLVLPDEEATARLVSALGAAVPAGFFYIALNGPLGAGKTHSVRCLLRALGETGPVRSPTYTLLEDYQTPARRLVHMDLYRLSDPEELEFLGLREMLDQDLLLCVEWADKGGAFLPEPDLVLSLSITGPSSRQAVLQAGSERGAETLHRLTIE